MKLYRFLVCGRVQGVGFRNFVEKIALLLGVQGYVRNLPDGFVEAVALLDEINYTLFVEALHQGPTTAEVECVECEVLQEAPLVPGFEIRY